MSDSLSRALILANFHGAKNMFFKNPAKSLEIVFDSVLICFIGWAAQQSNKPMENIGPCGSKSPEATLTALQMDTHKIQMINVYGNPLTMPAVYKAWLI